MMSRLLYDFGMFITGSWAIELTTGFSIRMLDEQRVGARASPNEYTDSVVTLERSEGASLSSSFLQTVRRDEPVDGIYSRVQSGNASIISVEDGSCFLAPITVGNQNLKVVIDTGSSDTWVVLSNFTCARPSTYQTVSQSACYFADYYTPTNTLNPISNRNFNISYADGETLNGVLAFENVSLAGIPVAQQEIALVDYAAWYGDSVSSGLIGLAYSSLTHSYTGDNPKLDTPNGNTPYDSLFATMYKRNLTLPLFSLALNRPATSGAAVSGGYLGIGGIPKIIHDPVFVSTPIEMVGIDSATNKAIYEFYSISLGGWAVANDYSTIFNPFPVRNTRKSSVINNGTNVIVDSGTTLIYAPDEVAEATAGLYSPPAAFSESYGLYTVACSSKPPLFGVDIGKKVFYVNPLDMVLPISASVCVTGVQPNQGGFSILGDAFLRNVLAVFDVGAGEMRFAAREHTSV